MSSRTSLSRSDLVRSLIIAHQQLPFGNPHQNWIRKQENWAAFLYSWTLFHPNKHNKVCILEDSASHQKLRCTWLRTRYSYEVKEKKEKGKKHSMEFEPTTSGSWVPGSTAVQQSQESRIKMVEAKRCYNSCCQAKKNCPRFFLLQIDIAFSGLAKNSHNCHLFKTWVVKKKENAFLASLLSEWHCTYSLFAKDSLPLWEEPGDEHYTTMRKCSIDC